MQLRGRPDEQVGDDHQWYAVRQHKDGAQVLLDVGLEATVTDANAAVLRAKHLTQVDVVDVETEG